ncbi:hypothetical protein E2320_014642 [Naja naja]|nr:hypothetical protein E2320_014642 [Naja naja]
MVAVILMGVYGLGCSSSAATNSSQNSQEMTGISSAHQQDENKTNSQIEKLRTCLRQHLCETTNTSTENGSCSVCPITWLPYEDKCYWISTSILSWDQSYRDCEAKRSQLLVISSTGEQEFIQKKTNLNTWIGFSFNLPEEKWRSQSLTAECGIIGKKGIASDMCNTELNWICQKPSVII